MWSEQDRQIFAAVIGGQQLYYDPERVLRLLNLHAGGRLNDRITAALQLQDELDPDSPGKVLRPRAEDGSPEHLAGLDAKGMLVAATLAAFGLAPIDPYTGQGTTESEAYSLLAQFLGWLRSKKLSGGT